MPFATAVKATIFEATVQGSVFKFAARSMRYMEAMIAKEKDAVAKGEQEVLKALHDDFMLSALNGVEGQSVTAEDLKDLDAPMKNGLFSAILKAHGMLPDSKVGEVTPQ
jgi:hypothetical protein